MQHAGVIIRNKRRQGLLNPLTGSEPIMHTSSNRAASSPIHALMAAIGLRAALGLATGQALAEPVVYRATVVTDIKLDGRSYHNAALRLTFTGDTNDAGPVSDASGKPVPSGLCLGSDGSGSGYFYWATVRTRE
jgi:hypothetical protein